MAVADEAIEYQEPSAVADVHAPVAPEPVAAEHAAVGYAGKTLHLFVNIVPLRQTPLIFLERFSRSVLTSDDLL